MSFIQKQRHQPVKNLGIGIYMHIFGGSFLRLKLYYLIMTNIWMQSVKIIKDMIKNDQTHLIPELYIIDSFLS